MSEDLPEEEQAGEVEIPKELSTVQKVEQEYLQKCAEVGQLFYQEWLHDEEKFKLTKRRETAFRYMKKLNNKAFELKQQEQKQHEDKASNG